MRSVLWPVLYDFVYPAGCTVDLLLGRLSRLAREWPGWERFPWRVTRNMQRFLGRPPVNFHYLMVQRCVTGYAAHLVLTAEFVDRAAVLGMMMREGFEIAGVLRALLLDSVRYEMRRTGLPYIQDSSGPEVGHGHVPKEELMRRRGEFRACLEGAVRDFVRVLDLASQVEEMDDCIFARPLRAWGRGADMPEREMLEVQVEETAEGMMLIPCRREVAAFVKAGKKVPRLMVDRSEWEETMRSVGQRREQEPTHRELKEHFDRRLDSVGQEFAGLQAENERLKLDLAKVLAGAARQVEPEFFQAVYAVLGAGSVSGGARVLKIPHSTLGGRLRAYAARGGLHKTLFDTIGVRRKLGAKSVERFNESFAEHQAQECGSERALSDLLDGIEAMDAGNWRKVRDELLDLLKTIDL